MRAKKKLRDVFLYVSTAVEIVCLDPRKYTLWHSTHQQIDTEVLDEFLMESRAYRMLAVRLIAH